MTILTGKTPTPAQFAKAIKDQYADAIRDAAGKDGRISRNEAKKIAERSDPSWTVSDNIQNYLRITGQKSVSAEKMIRELAEYAEQRAAQVAGSNQRLSLIEARSLPQDLQAEFFYLRGKGLPDRVTPQQLSEVVWRLVEAALDDETLIKLLGPPWQVMGKRPLIEDLPHPASKTRAIVYVVDDEIYVSRAASTGGGVDLVGWYSAGTVPAAL